MLKRRGKANLGFVISCSNGYSREDMVGSAYLQRIAEQKTRPNGSSQSLSFVFAPLSYLSPNAYLSVALLLHLWTLGKLVHGLYRPLET